MIYSSAAFLIITAERYKDEFVRYYFFALNVNDNLNWK